MTRSRYRNGVAINRIRDYQDLYAGISSYVKEISKCLKSSFSETPSRDELCMLLSFIKKALKHKPSIYQGRMCGSNKKVKFNAYTVREANIYCLKNGLEYDGLLRR